MSQSMRKSVSKRSNGGAVGGMPRPESLARRFRRQFPGVKTVERSEHAISIPKTPVNLKKLGQLGWPGSF